MARSARQLAASRRNIVAAQRASAASRRGKKRSKSTGHHYGKGKTGRRQSRINTYGKKKHGLSIAQQTRRKQRANKWKRRASVVASVAATSAAAYSQYHSATTPQQRKAHKAAVRAKGQDFKVAPRAAKMSYQTGRNVGMSRSGSAKWAAKAGTHAARGKHRR